ncbi:hypothetical protein CJ030_MR7G018913 [Morella rubra]|uniref:Uncharacterized protein n=1 Tax=Morella rubra TaxID=262757 RepID=A0A6A1V261_9ROSI|nr:hypothetical protein CJ030_MR7G018913 [Morella rubra]
MSKRARTSSQADIEQPSGSTLTLEQHTTIVMSRSIVVERDIKLADFYDLTFEGRTLPEVVEEIGWLPLIHRTVRSCGGPEDGCYNFIAARDSTDPVPALLLVPEGADEPRAVPVGSINKTTLSKSIAQTRRALNAARAARVRRQEQPEEVGEQQDPGQSSTQGFGAQRPGWMDDMMTQLTERMQSVLRPTHEMVSDISCRLTTLEQKVMDMDSGWKKEIAAVQEAMRKAATSAELFALTQRVVHIEEHLSQIRDVLKITDDDDDDL